MICASVPKERTDSYMLCVPNHGLLVLCKCQTAALVSEVSLVTYPSALAAFICNHQHGLRWPLLPRLRRSRWHPGSPVACWTGSSVSLISFEKTTCHPALGLSIRLPASYRTKEDTFPSTLRAQVIGLGMSEVEEKERKGLRVGDNFLF